MLLTFSDRTSFCEGGSPYYSEPASEFDPVPRIWVRIKVGEIATQAIIDTGGLYLICDPSLFGVADLDRSESLGSTRIVIRGEMYDGTLHRIPLTIPAQHGQNLNFEATAFVADIDPGLEWRLPTYLGWYCCLDRLRFAVDPATETFYFGAV